MEKSDSNIGLFSFYEPLIDNSSLLIDNYFVLLPRIYNIKAK